MSLLGMNYGTPMEYGRVFYLFDGFSCQAGAVFEIESRGGLFVSVNLRGNELLFVRERLRGFFYR